MRRTNADDSNDHGHDHQSHCYHKHGSVDINVLVGMVESPARNTLCQTLSCNFALRVCVRRTNADDSNDHGHDHQSHCYHKHGSVDINVLVGMVGSV